MSKPDVWMSLYGGDYHRDMLRQFETVLIGFTDLVVGVYRHERIEMDLRHD